MSTVVENLYQELESAKELCNEFRDENNDLRNQMSELSRDLRGVARILDVIHNVVEFTDIEANQSAFNNINRLVSDIASSLEASSNQ